MSQIRELIAEKAREMAAHDGVAPGLPHIIGAAHHLTAEVRREIDDIAAIKRFIDEVASINRLHAEKGLPLAFPEPSAKEHAPTEPNKPAAGDPASTAPEAPDTAAEPVCAEEETAAEAGEGEAEAQVPAESEAGPAGKKGTAK